MKVSLKAISVAGNAMGVAGNAFQNDTSVTPKWLIGILWEILLGNVEQMNCKRYFQFGKRVLLGKDADEVGNKELVEVWHV